VKKDWSSRIVTILLVSCALVSTGFVIRNGMTSTLPPTVTSRLATQKDWMDFADRGHRLGAADAAVTIVEFGDFECPACRALADRFDELLARRPTDVSILYRHMPLASHRFARMAAVAAECASQFGRFKEMHDTLYANQRSLGIRPWAELAYSAGITDSSTFSTCMRDSTVVKAVDRDIEAATRLRAPGTPTILIEGMRYTGVPPVSLLDSLIDAGVARKRRN
jgi:protein-disulfide isomerase